MKAAQFQYHAPETVEEALALLAEHGDDAKVLAGGQSLVPLLALRLTRFEHLIDLNRLTELQSIVADEDGVTIGAMTRQAVAEHSSDVARLAPLLAKAIPFIGHFQIRNRGTIGGSIAHADPASELPSVTSALDAELEVRGRRGVRRIPASEFFVSTWETAIGPDEVLTSVRFPRWGPRSGFSVEELALRTGDFALAGIACGVELDTEGKIARAAMAFMGMAPTPVRAGAAEAAAIGASPSEIDLSSLGELAVEATSPTDDIHASARYRRQVGAVLARRAFSSALSEASHA